MYKLIKDTNTGKVFCVEKMEGNILLSIPFSPDNTDYKAYLKRVAEGNEPLPANEVTDTPTV